MMLAENSRRSNWTRALLLLFFALGFGWFLLAVDKRIIDQTTDTLDAQSIKLVQTAENSEAWKIAIREAEELLSNTSSNVLPSCLVPDKKGTAALVKRALAEAHKSGNNQTTDNVPLIPFPVLNVGMPKCGSMTLYTFFDCLGFATTHWDIGARDFEGLCMRDAAKFGLPPIATCAPGKDALAQMDVEYPFGFEYSRGPPFTSNTHRDDCFFPQLSLLEAIHEEVPDATFVINFRPMKDWIKSVKGWRKMLTRFKACHLPNLPRGIPTDLDNPDEVEDTMTRFICSHILHLRRFVRSHPSHALIELDLYDMEGSRSILSDLFPTSPGKKTASECWEHTHKSKSKPKGKQSKGNRS